MQPVAPLPSFLASTPATAPARPRLLDAPPAAMGRDAYQPAPTAAYAPHAAYRPQPAAPAAYQPQPIYQPQPMYQPQPALTPVYSPQGQLVGYVQGPPAAPMPTKPAPSANQQTGQAALTTVTAGLGVAGVFAPPVLPIAGVVGLVQALDTQIGSPVAKTVGTVVNGVVDGGKAVGKFFGNLFGGKD